MAETLPIPDRQNIVDIATELVGARSIKYVRGHPELGQSRDGFDCSGFVRFVLHEAGLHVPDFIGMDNAQRQIRHTNEFWDHYGIATHMSQEGNLVFFSRNGLFPTHIGIMKDPDNYIHAPGQDDTKVSIEKLAPQSLKRRIKDGKEKRLYIVNPIGFKAPVRPIVQPTYRYHQELL